VTGSGAVFSGGAALRRGGRGADSGVVATEVRGAAVTGGTGLAGLV
jgi:hypothetical protein